MVVVCFQSVVADCDRGGPGPQVSGSEPHRVLHHGGGGGGEAADGPGGGLQTTVSSTRS